MKASINYRCGFVPSVLSRLKLRKPSARKGGRYSELSNIKRYLIVSIAFLNPLMQLIQTSSSHELEVTCE